MGETQSKVTINLGNLNENDVEKIKKKFNLNKKEGKISVLDFICAYPYILRPYVALILPSLHEIFKKKKKKSTQNDNHYMSYTNNKLFKKNCNKYSNQMTLQDIVTMLSYIINAKSSVIIRMLFVSFLRYSISNNRKSTDVLLKDDDKKKNTDDIIEDIQNKKEQHENIDQNIEWLEQMEIDQEQDTLNIKNISKKTSKIVLSDSNINEINKHRKHERNYHFIKENVFLMDQKNITYTTNKNFNLNDLIYIEETIHHILTYIYLELLWIINSKNQIFKFDQFLSDQNIYLNKSKTNINNINRKNSWDLTCFFKKILSLESYLDFQNIISGFRLFLNIKECNEISLYSLAIEYINNSFPNLKCIYIDATFNHFTNEEKILINDNDNKDNDLDLMNMNDLCINSIEVIHSLYKNIKKNELKNKEKKEEILKDKELYSKSSSILKVQEETGWRGLFLNKTSKILTDEIIFALRLSSKIFRNNEWFRLYASWKQGTSFNRFINSLLYYPDPIVIIIKTNDNQILGGVSTTPLKDSHLYHGCSEDFLFSASPIFRIIRTNGLGNNYLYLNSKNSFYPKGLGFGGKTECFRLFLSDEFKESYCTQSDYTYEEGRLYFPINKKKKKNECK